jgi:hypothetical protein
VQLSGVDGAEGLANPLLARVEVRDEVAQVGDRRALDVLERGEVGLLVPEQPLQVRVEPRRAGLEGVEVAFELRQGRERAALVQRLGQVVEVGRDRVEHGGLQRAVAREGFERLFESRARGLAELGEPVAVLRGVEQAPATQSVEGRLELVVGHLLGPADGAEPLLHVIGREDGLEALVRHPEHAHHCGVQLRVVGRGEAEQVRGHRWKRRHLCHRSLSQ